MITENALEKAYEIIDKYDIPRNFGYGGVSSLFILNKANTLKQLEDPEYWCSLWSTIGCNCGGYCGDLDELLLGLVKNYMDENRENNGIFFDKTQKQEIELLNYIMCSADILEYGSSPRFPWLTKYGEVVLDLYFKQKRPEWLDEEDV